VKNSVKPCFRSREEEVGGYKKPLTIFFIFLKKIAKIKD